MFMFRKKTIHVSTTEGLQEEAKRFQQAVAEINSTYAPVQLNISVIETIAEKYNVDVEFISGTFETYLKTNALNAIRRVKANSDFTYYDLEQASLAFGYQLDDLGVNFFSVE